MGMNATEEILGNQVASGGRVLCVKSIADWVAKGDRCRWLACLNPHSYVVSLRDGGFLSALRDADWLIPDGIGIVLASRLLRNTIRERVTGSDIYWGVHERLNHAGGASVFFLGSTEETLAMIRDRMARDFPNVRVAGTYSPPFKPFFSDEDTERMVAAINEAAPDVLWVGMTAPKQDVWIYQNRHRLNVKFAAGVGAVFDFFTGRVKRSHPFFQRLGLEWLPRMIREPRRLWNRTFVSAPIFLWHLAREKVSQRGGRSSAEMFDEGHDRNRAGR
jgi:N-acetylglucosaminyldiphosphoundecaprenol N-acetyl-beta-D-mannosaminyltransferase